MRAPARPTPGRSPPSSRSTETALPKYKGKTLPYAVCGYTPPQLRSAYGVANAGTGKGATVGIIDAYAAPTILTRREHLRQPSR